MPVRTLEKLASWSSRYATVCRQMKPFSSELYRTVKGRYRNVSINLRTEAPGAIRCIKMWRSLLCLLSTHGGEYQRPFSTFSQSAPSIVLEYDASLSGIGVIIYRFIDGVEVEWLVIQERFPYDLGEDSGYQNSVEFIAITIGVAALAAKGLRDTNIHVRGDSKSSLKWSTADSFRSKRCRWAATCFTNLAFLSGITVVSIEHIPGETNIRCDALSRSRDNGIRPCDLGFEDALVFDLSKHEAVKELLRLCEPRADVDSLDNDYDDDEFIKTWTASMAMCDAILALSSPN